MPGRNSRTTERKVKVNAMGEINEKDIPKKAKIEFYDGWNTICPWLCPTCEKPTFMKRCPYCGQLIASGKSENSFTGGYTHV